MTNHFYKKQNVRTKRNFRKSSSIVVSKNTDADIEKETSPNNIDYGDKKVRCKSLVIDNTKYRTRFNVKFENKKHWETPNHKKILSFIPGTVIKIFVKEGQVVKEGDNMLILEAMKMKNKVKFPVDGIVKSVRIKEGEKVSKDYLMIELE